jgi:hypothetical protein
MGSGVFYGILCFDLWNEQYSLLSFMEYHASLRLAKETPSPLRPSMRL